MKSRGVFVGLAVGLAVLGGACHATEAQLRSRAAFDLNCPKDQLQITEIDRRTRGVRACGQQATYIESCAGSDGSKCTWVLNTDSRREQ